MPPASTAETSAEMPAALRAELDDRYGRGPRRGRGVWIALGVLALGVLGYLGWTIVAQSANAVDIDTTGFQLNDAHSVSVDFQVTLRQGAAVTCVLEAQDEEHGVVGWRVVEYPADDAHSRRFVEVIPTVAEATTGLVTSCWIP